MKTADLARNAWALMTEGYAETTAAIAKHPNVVFWIMFSMLALVLGLI